MPVVAFVVDAIPSHAYASMGLARRLQARGYTCEYWGDAKLRELVREQGFGFRPLEGIWPRYQAEIRFPTDLTGIRLLAHPGLILDKLRARRRLRPRLAESLRTFESSLEWTLDTVRPSFAVFDAFLLPYSPYFTRRGITSVVLSSKPLPAADPLVPPSSSLLVPSPRRLTRLAIAASWARLRAWDAVIRVLTWLARRAGAYTHDDLIVAIARGTNVNLAADRVRRWIHPDLHFKSVPEWALWTKETDFPRQRPTAPNVFFVGPLVDVARRESALPVTRGSARFLVYVAVGTVRFRWKDNIPFLRKVIEAFRDDPMVDVVVSTGDERATAALGPTPANVRVYDFLPQLKMLDLADLVITHAGAGTYREAIAKQVPLLAYPRNHDQMGNSARIVFHRLGLRGRRERDEPGAIRAKALAILGDEMFRASLRRLRFAVDASEDQLLDRALRAIGVSLVVAEAPGDVPSRSPNHRVAVS